MKFALKSPSYLVRNPYSYCFRMVIPKDLRKFVGKTELRYTLRTGNLRVAKRKARLLAGQVQLIFIQLRKGSAALSKLSDDKIKKLVHHYIKHQIEEWDTRLYEPWDLDDPSFQPPFVDAETLDQYINDLDDIRRDWIANLNLGDFSPVKKSIDNLLKKNEINKINKNSLEYRKLCTEILKAEIQLIPMEKRHMQCDFSYRDELPNIFPEIFPKTKATSPVPETQISGTLQEVVEAMWKEKEPNWKKRTVVEYKTCRNHLLNFLGAETEIHTIGYPAGNNYKASLMEKGNKKGQPLSSRRINMYLSFASQLFNYARRNHYTEINPFTGLQISEKKTRVDELRDVFDEGDLKKLFIYSKEYSRDVHKHPHNFWVPILGLYTGCRLEELCQLYVSDVIKHEGKWCLNIVEDKPDKSVKTGEKRLVPLHPFLIDDLNFIEYVKSLPDQHGRVFPELKRINHRYGHNLGKWFSDFKERCGISALYVFKRFWTNQARN